MLIRLLHDVIHDLYWNEVENAGFRPPEYPPFHQDRIRRRFASNADIRTTPPAMRAVRSIGDNSVWRFRLHTTIAAPPPCG